MKRVVEGCVRALKGILKHKGLAKNLEETLWFLMIVQVAKVVLVRI
jgi:hypothetical protein